MLFSKIRFILLLFLLSVAIVVIFKVRFILCGNTTDGVVVETLTYPSRHSRAVNTIVEFQHRGEIITFSAIENLSYNRLDTVPVIYSLTHPEDAYVYTFWGFWWSGILYTLFIIIPLGGIAHAFMDFRDKLEISKKRLFFIHKFEKNKK